MEGKSYPKEIRYTTQNAEHQYIGVYKSDILSQNKVRKPNENAQKRKNAVESIGVQLGVMTKSLTRFGKPPKN